MFSTASLNTGDDTRVRLSRVSARFELQITFTHFSEKGKFCLSLGFIKITEPGTQRVLPNKKVGGGGGLGAHIKFGGKIWGKVRPSSQNRRKNLGSSVTKRRKSLGKVQILVSYLKFRGQNLGYLSFVCLEAKFGALTRISEAKFGAKPPRPPNMEVPSPPETWGYIKLVSYVP